MTLTDMVIVGIIALLLGIAIFCIHRSRKKGNPCIGCPGGGCCDCCNKQHK